MHNKAIVLLRRYMTAQSPGIHRICRNQSMAQTLGGLATDAAKAKPEV
jgi:hypothetical protein